MGTGHGVWEKEQFFLKTAVVESVAVQDSQILVRTKKRRVLNEEVEV